MGDIDTVDPSEVDVTLRGLTIVRHFLQPVLFRGRELRSQADEGADTTDEASDSLGTMEVRYSPFNQWYEVNSWWEGHFLERTVPGAFKRTINQHNDPGSSHDMKTLFNHGMDMFIDNKLLGDITDAREERDSPVNTVNVWDTSYNRDLLPGLKRGSYGSSFMFEVTKEEWDREPAKADHNPDGLPERTIKEVTNYEAGPVTWPASPTASASMNGGAGPRRGSVLSGTDAYYEALAARSRDGVTAMRQNVIALRTAGRLAGYGARPEVDSQRTDPDDSHQPAAQQPPVERSTRGLSPAERRRRIFLLTNG